MDIVFEYAVLCGGVPEPEVTWWTVLGLVTRGGRVQARQILALCRGVQLGAAPLVSDKNEMMANIEVEQLKRKAVG